MSFRHVIDMAKENFRNIKLRNLREEQTRLEADNLRLEQELHLRQTKFKAEEVNTQLRSQIDTYRADKAKLISMFPESSTPGLSPARSVLPSTSPDVASMPKVKQLFPNDPDVKFFGK